MSQLQLNMSTDAHPSYFNTTGLKGEYLESEKSKAKTEERIVHEYFLQHPGEDFTRDEVHEGIKATWKVDNTGRCLTNLMNAKILVKLKETKRTGHIYGKTLHAYKLK